MGQHFHFANTRWPKVVSAGVAYVCRPLSKDWYVNRKTTRKTFVSFFKSARLMVRPACSPSSVTTMSELPTEKADNDVERLSRWKGNYSHPMVQVILLGLVCLLCYGLYLALLGLGAAGQIYAKGPANAAVAIYAASAVFGFFSGYKDLLCTRYVRLFLTADLGP